jgi:FkbM family methyltransferase
VLRRALRRLRRRRWEFERAFRTLRPGDVAIDCGANIGRYATLMADRGATLYAFEPNPWAFAELERLLGDRPNVHLRQAAVGVHAGEAELHLHRHHDQDEVVWSVGSSLFESKPNVSADSLTVEVVDLPAFIAGLDAPVALLKIDVEGSEIELLNALHAPDLLGGIRTVLVEMHDTKIDELRESGAALRQLVARRYPNVRLDWE